MLMMSGVVSVSVDAYSVVHNCTFDVKIVESKCARIVLILELWKIVWEIVVTCVIWIRTLMNAL